MLVATLPKRNLGAGEPRFGPQGGQVGRVSQFGRLRDELGCLVWTALDACPCRGISPTNPRIDVLSSWLPWRVRSRARPHRTALVGQAHPRAGTMSPPDTFRVSRQVQRRGGRQPLRTRSRPPRARPIPKWRTCRAALHWGKTLDHRGASIEVRARLLDLALGPVGEAGAEQATCLVSGAVTELGSELSAVTLQIRYFGGTVDVELDLGTGQPPPPPPSAGRLLRSCRRTQRPAAVPSAPLPPVPC